MLTLDRLVSTFGRSELVPDQKQAKKRPSHVSCHCSHLAVEPHSCRWQAIARRAQYSTVSFCPAPDGTSTYELSSRPGVWTREETDVSRDGQTWEWSTWAFLHAPPLQVRRGEVQATWLGVGDRMTSLLPRLPPNPSFPDLPVLSTETAAPGSGHALGSCGHREASALEETLLSARRASYLPDMTYLMAQRARTSLTFTGIHLCHAAGGESLGQVTCGSENNLPVKRSKIISRLFSL